MSWTAGVTTEDDLIPLLVAALISLLVALIGGALVSDFRGARSTLRRDWQNRHGKGVADRSNLVTIAVGVAFLAVGGFLFVQAVKAFLTSLA